MTIMKVFSFNRFPLYKPHFSRKTQSLKFTYSLIQEWKPTFFSHSIIRILNLLPIV